MYISTNLNSERRVELECLSVQIRILIQRHIYSTYNISIEDTSLARSKSLSKAVSRSVLTQRNSFYSEYE